jgi:lipopolysaccharide/colanic/teichoic acid biosynthesis glycosyltransferase
VLGRAGRLLDRAVIRMLDTSIALVLLLIALPVVCALAIAIKLDSPGPVFYRCRRAGQAGREFLMVKFRKMRDDAEGPALTAPEDERFTRVGKTLARTKLDELPQLVNVLKGEMSLVGPRPERPEFARQFERDVHRYGERHRVKSGITGWAQVHGLRGKTSIADRAEWDNFYIENFSLWLDLKILIMTFGAVSSSFRKVE